MIKYLITDLSDVAYSQLDSNEIDELLSQIPCFAILNNDCFANSKGFSCHRDYLIFQLATIEEIKKDLESNEKITNFKCPYCANGVVVMSATIIKNKSTFEVQACNICNKTFGRDDIKSLKMI